MVEPGWTTADYALVISVFSAVVSVAGFVWNIWSKFIYPKPRLLARMRTSLLVGTVHNLPSVLSFSAINHGPGDITLKQVIGKVRKKYPWSKSQRAILKCYLNWPHSLQESEIGQYPNLPCKLEVGDSYDLHFPTNIFVGGKVTDLAFVDGFGREHWSAGSSRQNLKAHN